MIRVLLASLALASCAASAQTLTHVADVDVNAQAFFAPYTSSGGAVYFAGLAPGDPAPVLWRTDGTPAGTTRLDALGIAPGARGLVPFGERVYFVATVDPGNGEPVTNGLFRTTASGMDVERFSGVTRIDGGGTGQLTPTTAGLYFTACTDAEGCEVWRTDGTAANRVQDLCPGSCDAAPSGYTDLGGTVLFAATDGTSGAELYRALGPGLSLVRDILPGGGSSLPGSFFAWAGQVYFSATGPDASGANAGRELWSTAGGDAGLVVNAGAGALGSSPQPVGRAGGKLIVVAQPDAAVGQEPYAFDGSSLTLVRDIRPGFSGSRIQCAEGPAALRFDPNCAQADDAFYFLAAQATLDTRLFVTDGTSATEVPASDGGRLGGPLLAVGTEVYAQTCSGSYSGCALERVPRLGEPASRVVALPENSQAVSVGTIGGDLLLELGTRDPVTLLITHTLVRLSGLATSAAPGEVSGGVRLSPPFPNPASGEATVSFELDRPQAVRLTLYDALGRSVRVLVDGPQVAGTHRAPVTTDGLPAGVYSLVLDAEGAHRQRLTVVR